MTKNPGLKARIKAYMHAHGVNYTTALRAVRASAPKLPAPPAPPTGLTTDDDMWFDPSPTVDQLVGGVLTHEFEQLLNEPIGAHGLGMPAGAPAVRDPRVLEVSPEDWSLIVDSVDNYDGDELGNGTMRAEVTLCGEMDLADALAAEAAGTARRETPGDIDDEVTVIVTGSYDLEIEAAVLYERTAELADLQEVLALQWRAE